jgi:spore photoproduct lyase
LYDVRPPALYIHERALATPECRARVERLLPHIHCEPEIVDDARLNAVAEAGEWLARSAWRTGQWNLTGDPVLVLNAFTWDSPEALAERRGRFPALAGRMLDGDGAWSFRDGRRYTTLYGTVCQDAWELHSAFGCLHRCDYCHVGGFATVMVNLEELAERLPALLDANPWLRLWKYDNQTDQIPFEPEYGASELLVGRFAQQAHAFLMLYTKSDNVDHLLGLDPRGRTIVSFTISGPTVAQRIEHATPSSAQRIAAAAKVQQAGYVPRVRFSPIVPILGWREELRGLIDDLLREVSPDLITIDLLGWVNPADLDAILDTSLLDRRFLQGMRDLYANGPPGPGYWPRVKHIFPHDLRREVYDFVLDEIGRRDSHSRVSICNETLRMWSELGPRLGMAPENYVCGCGPTSVPGEPLL